MSLPRMSLHIGDYRKDTAHLDAALHGAYLLLIMHYWATGSVPGDDDAQLARIACMTKPQWAKAKPIMYALFKEGNWRHKRIDEELATATAKYERRAAAGQMGGNATAMLRQNPSNAGSNAGSNATQTPPAIGQQSPSNPNPIKKERKERGGREHAREAEPLVSAEAIGLAKEIAEIAGFPSPQDWPPGWCGAPMRVHTMLAEGWRREVMLASARETMAKKRDGPPDSITYFEKPFARAHARQAAPLPVVQHQIEPEKVHGRNVGTAGGDSLKGALARLASAADRARASEDEEPGSGPPPPRLLSHG